MSGGEAFSPRMLIGWIAIASLLFAGTLYVMGGGRMPGGGDRGSGNGDIVSPSSYSSSAIGHAGIVETLRRLGIPTLSSQGDSLAKLSAGSVLVLAEPGLGVQSPQNFRSLLTAKTILLILPKRYGDPSTHHTGWVDKVALVPLKEASAALDLLQIKAELIRHDDVADWTINALGPLPSLATPIQLLRSTALRPIIAGEEGILLGERIDKGQRIWILSDPDLIANHGLLQKDNAVLTAAIIDALRGPDGKVIFDETIHGYVARSPSPFRLLFDFPFVIATSLAAVTCLLLLWATMARFGAPESRPPVLGAGKLGLIRNAARLLEFARDQTMIVRRYMDLVIRDAADQLHAPPTLQGEARLLWLQRVAEARSVKIDGVALCRSAEAVIADRRRDTGPLMTMLYDLYRWKQGIVDGSSGHSRPH